MASGRMYSTVAEITEPMILPIPPRTTNTRILMDVLKLNLDACKEEKFRPNRTPAMPARNAETTKAFMRKVVTLMPTDSAAIRLSRTALMARPSLEFTRFSTTNRVNMISAKPMGNVDSFCIPVAPIGPEMIILPPSPSSIVPVVMAMWKPSASVPTYRLLIMFFMISPKASVTMAK